MNLVLHFDMISLCYQARLFLFLPKKVCKIFLRLSFPGDLLFGIPFRASRSLDSVTRPLQVWKLFFRKNRNIYLTRIDVYVIFLKYRLFSKEICIKAFRFLINFFFICHFQKILILRRHIDKKVAKFKQKENENDFQKHIYDPAKYLW